MLLVWWLAGALFGGIFIWWSERREERKRKILHALSRMSDYELKRLLKGGITFQGMGFQKLPNGTVIQVGPGTWTSQTITITYK